MFHRSKRTKGAKDESKLTLFQRYGLFFFNHTRVTLLLWVLLTSFGVACYTTFMQREGFPNVAGPYSTVSGTYFVNNKERVDREVAKPLAQAVAKLGDVKQVSSQAGDNFFSLQIEFKDKVVATDGNSEVQRTISDQHLLPTGAKADFKPLFISKLTPDGDDMLISISSDQLNSQQLQQKADTIATALGQGGSAAIDGAERVKASETFRTGNDPETGKSVSEQKSFDWIATSQDGKVTFAPSILVAVQAKKGVDILHLDDAAQKSLQTLRNDPQYSGLKFTVAADFAESIRTQVSGLQDNLLGGLIAVLVVSFLLISFRASLITAISMSTVLAITVGALYVFGYTLNTITLFSLILCLGLIVDDTTIVVEAIDKGRRSGARAHEVVATALKKVALASTAGTLMTMMGFAPLLFISGIMGQFIHAIPVTIITSLAVSLLVSITLIPFLARFTLLRGEAKKLSNPISKLETATAHGLSQLVRRVGKSRKQGVAIGLTAILLSFIMLGAGAYFAGKLKFDIFPPTKDSDAVLVDMSFAPGSTITASQATSARANQIISDTIGQYVRRVSYQGSGSDSDAHITVDLVSFKKRDPTSPELAQQLQDKFANFTGAKVQVHADAGPAPAGSFTMQVRSEDSTKSKQLATAIQEYLEGRELKRPNGTVAHIHNVEVSGSNSIQRDNGVRYLQIDGSFDADDTSTLVPITQDLLKKGFDNDRVQRQFGLDGSALKYDVGQESQNQDSFKSMLIAFPILLVAMYILLAIQFRSTSQPLMIFLAIPFSFFGVTAGLYFTHNSFSFFTMLAIFALLGIAVNNTILLTDYANQGRKRGLRRSEAMASALEERFRPLLTTSLTSVVALIPLALSDPFWEALAFTLIFGLLSSTFLVVVAFPYYYLGNELIRSRFNRWRAIGWLVLLIVGGVAVSKLVGKAAGNGFMLGYILLTIAFLIGRAVKRRRNR
ncbi:MAG TPA: efflux RND transporter permease subunit [Candidatus Saccharimonadales bacterium]|nr:efflux RND transporter permease subunit [Candidatus Saccharimonadales bacterium]